MWENIAWSRLIKGDPGPAHKKTQNIKMQSI